MNVPGDWPLVVLALGAGAFAILAGGQLGTALPLSVVAIALAGLLVAGSMRRVAWAAPTAPPIEAPLGLSTLRAAFRAGRAGRLSIVLELDQLERRTNRPGLATRSPEEDDEILHMTNPEFQAYLRTRLDLLEQGGP